MIRLDHALHHTLLLLFSGSSLAICLRCGWTLTEGGVR